MHLERFRDPRKLHEDLTKVTEAVTISGERELSMDLTEIVQELQRCDFESPPTPAFCKHSYLGVPP